MILMPTEQLGRWVQKTLQMLSFQDQMNPLLQPVAISFIDDFSGYAVAKLLNYKSLALRSFQYVAQYGRPKFYPIENETE